MFSLGLRNLTLSWSAILTGLWRSCLPGVSFKNGKLWKWLQSAFCRQANFSREDSLWPCISSAISKPELLLAWSWRTSWGQLARKGHLGPTAAVGGLRRWEQAPGSTINYLNAPADNLWHQHFKRIAPFIIFCIDVPSSVHNTAVWELLLVGSQSNPLFFVFWSLPACAESTVAVINSGRAADSLWKTITYGCRVLLKARFMGSSIMAAFDLLVSFGREGLIFL